MLSVLHITEPPIDTEFLLGTYTGRICNSECPVCLENIAGREIVTFACFKHAVCKECNKGALSTCPLCRERCNPLQLHVVSLSTVKELVGDKGVEFDGDGIRDAFQRVVCKFAPKTREGIAYAILQSIIESPHFSWAELWRIKKFTSELNLRKPDRRLQNWNLFIKKVSDARTRLQSKLDAEFHILQAGELLELRMR